MDHSLLVSGGYTLADRQQKPDRLRVRSRRSLEGGAEVRCVDEVHHIEVVWSVSIFRVWSRIADAGNRWVFEARHHLRTTKEVCTARRIRLHSLRVQDLDCNHLVALQIERSPHLTNASSANGDVQLVAITENVTVREARRPEWTVNPVRVRKSMFGMVAAIDRIVDIRDKARCPG